MMEENSVSRDNLVTLTDDEGNEHDFVVIDAFVVDEKRYAILLPVDDSENDGAEVKVDYEENAYIFRVEMDDRSGEETLTELDDEEEWKRVALAWESRLELLEEEDAGDAEEESDDYF